MKKVNNLLFLLLGAFALDNSALIARTFIDKIINHSGFSVDVMRVPLSYEGTSQKELILAGKEGFSDLETIINHDDRQVGKNWLDLIPHDGTGHSDNLTGYILIIPKTHQLNLKQYSKEAQADFMKRHGSTFTPAELSNLRVVDAKINIDVEQTIRYTKTEIREKNKKIKQIKRDANKEVANLQAIKKEKEDHIRGTAKQDNTPAEEVKEKLENISDQTKKDIEAIRNKESKDINEIEEDIKKGRVVDPKKEEHLTPLLVAGVRIYSRIINGHEQVMAQPINPSEQGQYKPFSTQSPICICNGGWDRRINLKIRSIKEEPKAITAEALGGSKSITWDDSLRIIQDTDGGYEEFKCMS